MRVAFLTWRDSGHPDGGGSEVYVEQVARELVRRGHRVTLVCADYPGASAYERSDGVDVVRLGGRLTVYPRALAWLARHSRRVDVVVDVMNGLISFLTENCCGGVPCGSASAVACGVA